jgi:pimeloyl-ACP methyl ester carboxylesterase
MERFSSFDGQSIAYGVSGDEPDTNAAVLLHHGFASTSRINWIRPGLVGALEAVGRRVVVIDARGHGQSDRPHEPEAYGGGAMVRDVVALLDHLGLERVDLAGYSMGAFVAIGVAAAGELRLRSLLLGGAGIGQVRGSRPEVASAIAEALEADSPTAIESASARAYRNFADATGQDRFALAAIQRSGIGLDVDAAAAVSVPTVVVNGEQDTLVGDPYSLGGLIRGARTIIVPGDHLSAVMKAGFREALVVWATEGH